MRKLSTAKWLTVAGGIFCLATILALSLNLPGNISPRIAGLNHASTRLFHAPNSPVLQAASSRNVNVIKHYGELPLSFEPNASQPNSPAKFLARGNGYALFLANDEAVPTKGQMVQVNLTASTSLHSAKDFANLVIKQANGAIVRLKDVANVTLGADDYETQVSFDGKQAVYIGIQVAPAANLLDVIAGVRKAFPGIHDALPQGLRGAVIYDSTDFVNSSIREVIWTLGEALVIVTLVIFAFLGSLRSVFVATAPFRCRSSARSR